MHCNQSLGPDTGHPDTSFPAWVDSAALRRELRREAIRKIVGAQVSSGLSRGLTKILLILSAGNPDSDATPPLGFGCLRLLGNSRFGSLAR